MNRNYTFRTISYTHKGHNFFRLEITNLDNQATISEPGFRTEAAAQEFFQKILEEGHRWLDATPVRF